MIRRGGEGHTDGDLEEQQGTVNSKLLDGGVGLPISPKRISEIFNKI